ncbi:MAG TPA: hypothetical protein VFO65_06770 [Acidimicrobiales bacterium]|nr:hypothetical protein [Acidimicrobiales bacterium]
MDAAGGLPQLSPVSHLPHTQPRRGWRYWQVQADAGILRSVTHRRVRWRPHTPLRAVCLIGGHEAPAAGCACGIHATADLDRLRDECLCLAPTDPLVVGEVSLWGTVIDDDHGLRGEFGYPHRLRLVVPEGGDPNGPALSCLETFGVRVDRVGPAEAVGEAAAAVMAFQQMSR